MTKNHERLRVIVLEETAEERLPLRGQGHSPASALSLLVPPTEGRCIATMFLLRGAPRGLTMGVSNVRIEEPRLRAGLFVSEDHCS